MLLFLTKPSIMLGNKNNGEENTIKGNEKLSFKEDN
jgi:hypothetical protein